MDQGTPQMQVRTEREYKDNNAIAIISGGGGLGLQLADLFINQGIKIEWVKTIEETAAVTAARFLVLFLDEQKINAEGDLLVKRFVGVAKRFSAKFVVVFQGVNSETQQKTELILKEDEITPTIIEIRPSTLPNASVEKEVAGKIARLAISSRSAERLVVGEFGGQTTKFEEQHPIPNGKIVSSKTRILKMPSLKPLLWGLAFASIILLPLVVFGFYVSLATGDILRAKDAVSSGNFTEGTKAAGQARTRFALLKDSCIGLSLFGQLDIMCEGFSSLELASDTLYRGAVLQGQFLTMSRAFFSPDGEAPNVNEFALQASLGSQAIEENLGFLEARLTQNYGLVVSLAERFGISEEKIRRYLGEIPKMRFLAKAGKEIAPVTPEVLGTSTFFSQIPSKKTYLLVFQNSAELRASGGFIGSYAIVHVDNGRLLDFKINDIYSVDGQLKGRIAPPDEILHYLGQPSWFMRDANFSPDFPLTAKRLAWFLEKESGQKVDGVIGINIEAVEKIIEALGEISVPSSKEPITALNFFQKAEYASEINFFPGSTQKRDFLGEVAEAIFGRIVNEEDLAYGKLSLGITKALEQKDIMFYFNSVGAQRAVEESGFGGSIAPANCNLKQNCLMVVEDNFGANKANYFLKKEMKISSTLDKGGGVTNQIQLTIENQSPNDSWPGGRYKDYLRFLVPNGAKLLEVSLGDNRTASVSSILTAEVLSKVKPSEFLVFQTKEQVLVTSEATPSGFQSFGMLVEVPVKTKKVVNFKYGLDKQLDFSKKSDKFQLTVLKQPGSKFDPFLVTVGYPSFLEPNLDSNPFELAPIVYPQELIYNTVLDKDRNFEIKFNQKQ